MRSDGRPPRGADDSIDAIRVLVPSHGADRAPRGAVVVRLTAVDESGYTYFYDEMVVTPDAFRKALERFAQGGVESGTATGSSDDASPAPTRRPGITRPWS